MTKRLFVISMYVMVAIVIALIAVSFAYAAPPTGTISYTVTEKVNMTADSAGNLVIDPVVIENTGEFDISVDSIAANGANGWTLVPDTTDFTTLPADSKQVSMVANGHDLTSDYINVGVIDCFHSSDNNSMSIPMTGRTGAAITAVEDELAANIVVTVSVSEYIVTIDSANSTDDCLTFNVYPYLDDPYNTVIKIQKSEDGAVTWNDWDSGTVNGKLGSWSYSNNKFSLMYIGPVFANDLWRITIVVNDTEYSSEPITFDNTTFLFINYNQQDNIFSAVVENGTASSYEWQISRDGGRLWETIPNANSNTYVPVENGTYRCKATIEGAEYITGIVELNVFNEFVITEENREMIGYTDDTTELVIPETFQKDGIWYRVVGIGDNAFWNCSNLEEVNIPKSVSDIGNSSFEICENLKSVELSGNLKTIGSSAFCGCGSLTSINIPDSLISLGEYAFQECPSLISINIPAGIEVIEEGTFESCFSLEEIVIGDNIREIKDYAFSGCDTLKSIDIPDSVVSIGEGAFSYCNKLTTIQIGNGLANMGNDVFYVSDITETTVTTENDVAKNYDWVSDHRTVTFHSPFNIIPSGGIYTTAGGEKLQAGDIFPEPQTNDTYEYGEYIYIYNDGSEFATNWHATVEDNTKTAYSDMLSEISGKPVDNLTYTFDLCENLQSAPYLSDNALDMFGTFSGCSSLTDIKKIPSKVTNMAMTFENCTALSIAPDIPDGVTNMDSTFSGCIALLAAPDIPNSVTNMSFTFFNCLNLESVKSIPEKVEMIDYIFYGCGQLSGRINVYCNPRTYESAFEGTALSISIITNGNADGMLWRNIAGTSFGNGKVTGGTS